MNEHTHEHEDMHSHGIEGRDLEVLSLLLGHWADHNKDHAAEYQKWVDKLEADGKNEVADCIKEAIALMAQADEHLIAAKAKLVK